MLATPNSWIKKNFVRLARFEKQVITKEDRLTIVLDYVDIEAKKSKLEKALVGHTLGKKFLYHFFNIDLRHKWGKWGKFQLILLTSDYFMFIFSSIEAYDVVLMIGP